MVMLLREITASICQLMPASSPAHINSAACLRAQLRIELIARRGSKTR